MTVTQLEIPDVLLLRSDVFADARGWFEELWNRTRPIAGLPSDFVQDNAAYSKRGVVRGLHLQDPHPQGKLVVVVYGEIFDVAVDLRLESATFGKWVSAPLAARTGHSLYIPEGFAHGYQVVSNEAVVMYKCTRAYHPEAEHTLAWNDPELAIPWPVADAVLSNKDAHGSSLTEIRERFQHTRASCST